MKTKNNSTTKINKAAAEPKKVNVPWDKTNGNHDRILFLASLVDNISDALISTDLEFNILEWNKAAEIMYGWTAGEVVGHPLQEFVQNEFADTTREEVVKSVLERGIWKGELTQNRRDGGRIPVRASVSLIKDQGDQPLGFVAINCDLSERKQAEEKLRQSEEHYRLIAQHAEDIIWTMDMQLRLTYVSPSLERALGYTAAEIMALPPEHFLVRESFAGGLNVFYEEVAMAQPQPNPSYARVLELEYRRQDGSTFWSEMKFSFFRDADGRPTGILGVGRDITERKRAEQALRESEKRLRALLQISQALSTPFELNTILQLIVDNATQLMNLDSGAFYLLENDVLFLATTSPSLPPGFPDEFRQAALAEHPHIQRAISSGSAVILPDTTTSDLARAEREISEARGLRSILYLPLIIGKKAIGVLILASVHELRTFREEEIALYQGFAGQAAQIVENVQLYESTRKYADELGIRIAERRQAEEALRASEQRFSTLFAKAPYAVTLSKLSDSVIVDANEAVERIFGFTQQEVIGKTYLELGFEPDAEIHTGLIAQLEQNNSAYIPEMPLRTKSGETRICSVHVDVVDIGGENYILNSAEDITEHKQAEEALRESQFQLTGIIESAMDAIIIIDADQKITLFNRAAEAVFGYSAAELIGQPHDCLVPERYRTAHKQQVERFGETGVTSRAMDSLQPLSGLRANGEEFPMEASISQIEVAGRKFFTVILRDITNRKRAEERIKRQLHRLEALHQIDITITSGLDMTISLGLLLDQIRSLLDVDAAVVLLLEPHTQVLRFAAGRGFHSNAIQHTELRIGKGYAGSAALKRSTVHIPDLSQGSDDLTRALSLAHEKFIAYYAIPLVIKGQVKGVLEIFHRSALEPDGEWHNFAETLANQAAIMIEDAQLFSELQRSNFELLAAYDATIEGWSRAMDLRDKETEGHTQRVTNLVIELARHLGIPEVQIVHIRRGALLHDIGKLGVPDNILLKSDALTNEEWAFMRKHPQFAYEMLADIHYLRPALDIPHCHHEKWDGSGYPRGLKGEQIPLPARIFAVVDVWDALTSDRPYRKAWSQENTIEYIKEQAGSYFDPQVVKTFLNMKRLT